MKITTIMYSNNRLKIIDQRFLPGKLVVRECKTLKDAYYYIKTLAVRGAPAIGVFAAHALCIGLKNASRRDKSLFLKKLNNAVRYLKESRPTAVNLFWALDRMRQAALKRSGLSVAEIKKAMLDEAKKIYREDVNMCDRIGLNGASLIRSGDTILTHCNAGFLATAGDGTALSVIYKAKKQNKNIKVYADETRPLLQGARLTTWELGKRGVDVTLICDNMAATLMKQGRIQKIIVGADRIAGNGDAANKIGTYGVAVLAKEHNIPFYVAAPSSTFDFKLKHGDDIPIEQRDADELRRIGGKYIAPKNVKVYNPAFDVTPNRLISAIITEKGVFKKPYGRSLKKLRKNQA